MLSSTTTTRTSSMSTFVALFFSAAVVLLISSGSSIAVAVAAAAGGGGGGADVDDLPTPSDLVVEDLDQVVQAFGAFDGTMYAGSLPMDHVSTTVGGANPDGLRTGFLQFWLFVPNHQAAPDTLSAWVRCVVDERRDLDSRLVGCADGFFFNIFSVDRLDENLTLLISFCLFFSLSYFL